MEKKISNYKVVKYQKLSELEKEVADLIGEGWQPLGGVAIANENLDHAQAMVKYE